MKFKILIVIGDVNIARAIHILMNIRNAETALIISPLLPFQFFDLGIDKDLLKPSASGYCLT
jgi:hypothetical protein